MKAAISRWKVEKPALNAKEIAIVSEIIDIAFNIIQSACVLTELIKNERDLQRVQVEFVSLLRRCEELESKSSAFHFHNVRPIVAEYTDAGPGIGISNIAVKFRFAEMCRIQNSDQRIRLHRDRGDSGGNEAERTNACIGDAHVDGGTIKWQCFESYHGLSSDNIDKMTIDQLETHKESVMEKNAWMCAEEVRLRIDDEKGPGGDFMSAYVTERQGK